MTDVPAKRREGTERFHSKETDGPTVHEFWQWSASDLLGNALRGHVAEFLVASAVGVAGGGLRTEWDTVDVVTPEGLKVEVKSCAHVQRWAQRRPSRIVFGIRETIGWDGATGTWAVEKKRHADVYVFALLDEHDRARVDPLDLDQWTFFVLPTRRLDEAHRGKRGISLQALRDLGPESCKYGNLAAAIRNAGRS